MRDRYTLGAVALQPVAWQPLAWLPLAWLTLALLTLGAGACGSGSSSQDVADSATETSDACNGDCPCDPGQHLCGGACVSDDAVTTCGASCDPCPGDDHGAATCDGTRCGLACDDPYLACDGRCVDATSDPSHCGSCTLACNEGGTCFDGTCEGGLFGACEVDDDCAAVPRGVCVDNASEGGPDALTGFPQGLCTKECTARADCGQGNECVAVGERHVCVPQCEHGADCRDGYLCLPMRATQVCLPACDHDEQCGGFSFCNPLSGYCQDHPVADDDPGSPDGAPCGIAPDGGTNCRGQCTPAWARDPDGTTHATGYSAGECTSHCAVGPEWAGPLTSFPASTCPVATVCVPDAVPVVVGDLGSCMPLCNNDSQCRDGYACKRGVRPDDAFSNGYCAPIDCADGVHACVANEYCETGFDADHPAVGRCHPPNIQHVVLIVQENHTFDSYFGRYCTAPTGSAPDCTEGRGCCERAPEQLSGHAPVTLTSAENYAQDLYHDYECEVCQVDGGKMDRYVTGNCPGSASSIPPTAACSDPLTFAVADEATLGPYWAYADRGALADRYFQPIIGSTSSNDMYLAVAHYEFRDNDIAPDAYGSNCVTDQESHPEGGYRTLTGKTVGDVLLDAGVSFTVYADGYGDALDAAEQCNDPVHSSCPCTTVIPSDCRESAFFENACTYDGSDIPFQYYARFRDDPHTIVDYERRFTRDVDAGLLPAFSFIKFRTSRNEHPSWSYISDGEGWVAQAIDAVEGSPLYRDNTLILLTWDEGGGYYDHVAPPPSVEIFPPTDPSKPSMAGLSIPYGTRVPMLALGPFARHGYVSHVQMEHSSVVRFLEYLFVGPLAQGALSARDLHVQGLGSLLDADAIGVPVP